MNEPQGPTPSPYDPTRFTPWNGPVPPWSGGHVPPSWPPMPPVRPPHGNRRLLWALLGLVCVLTAVVVALVVILPRHDGHEIVAQSPSTTSTPATSHQRAPVPVSALEGLLPDKGFVASAAAAPGVDLVAHGEGIDVEDLVDADCQGVVAVSSRAYVGSGWTAIRWQHWNNPPETANSVKLMNHVSLSVAAYPHANAARTFYVKQSDAWRKCAGDLVNGQPASATEYTGQLWVITEVTASDRAIAATAVNAEQNDWSCRSMMAVRNNIVVRVATCARTGPAAAAQTILDSITAKIDAAA